MRDKLLKYWQNNICNCHSITGLILFIFLIIILLAFLPIISWFLLVPMKQAVVRIANSEMLLGMIITGIITPICVFFLNKQKK